MIFIQVIYDLNMAYRCLCLGFWRDWQKLADW